MFAKLAKSLNHTPYSARLHSCAQSLFPRLPPSAPSAIPPYPTQVFAKLAKSLEHTEAQVVRMLADHKALVNEQQAVDRANTKVGTQVWGAVAGQGLGRAGKGIRTQRRELSGWCS